VPWFKVDDKHHDHRKTRRALRGVRGKRRDAGAMGLWELAGSWCADNLMDGFVPTDELYRWDDDAEVLAGRLVDAGYWVTDEREGEAGYRFLNWEEHQPMKADVEAKRQAAKERMARIRATPRSGSGDVRANDAAGSQRPSRPVPTRPDPEAKTRAVALIDDRLDVLRICKHLADRIEENGAKRPNVGKAWLTAARLMLDNDGRPEAEVHQAIEWATRDSFWMSNILSMPKLREKYDQLKLQASRPARQTRQQETDGIFERSAQRLGVVPGGGI
jgi:hypothetical protein